jgi:tellurite resistance protein
VRLTPNLFAIPFGLCGLAQCWSLAAAQNAAPAWPADTLSALAAVAWAGLLVAYVRNAVAAGRLRTELADPTFGPFTSLVVIVPMLLGTALARHAHGAGEAVFLVALVATVLLGSWLVGEWIVSDLALAQWHPGYFLPTVAGGLLAAGGCAAFGYDSLARLMFGYGAVCWIVLGSVILLRLFTQPALPAALTPTIAIELAPPVVAGAAWFEINGGRADAVALGLAGYAVLMVVVQVRLAPLYRRLPFGPGWWSFSFSYAAAFAIAIRWLTVEDAPGQRLFTQVLLAVITAWLLVLAARTGTHLARGTFLPRPAPAPREPAAPVAERARTTGIGPPGRRG